jgi:hypothetical protein
MNTKELKLVLDVVEKVSGEGDIPILRNESRDGETSYTSCRITVEKNGAGELFILVS